MKKLLIIFIIFSTIQFVYPQTYGILHNFGGTDDGSAPYGSLIVSDSVFYGMTSSGGTNKLGTIFKIDCNGSNYQILHSFSDDPSDGSTPNGRLLKIGNSLFGMAFYGGEFNQGVIFKINTDGSGFGILHSFGETFNDGATPYGSLLLSGDSLYGMTYSGGNNNKGTIFKINIDSSGYEILHTFGDILSDGIYPGGTLILNGKILYGMASNGGKNSAGTIFKMNLDGTGYSTLHSFIGSGINSEGSSPTGLLLLSDSILYGMTYFGGPNNNGTLFRLNLDGSNFKLMHSFDGNTSDGSGGFTLSLYKSTLYGVSILGGTKNNGTIFSIDTGGKGYNILYSFEGYPNDAGNAPLHEGLLLFNNSLYGMSIKGGISDMGTIFYYVIQQSMSAKDSCDSNYVEYSNFGNSKEISLNSAAKMNNSEIRITPASNNLSGSIFYEQPLKITNGFHTEFSFRFSDGFNDVPDGSPPGADGIAFVIQATNPGYYGKTGGGLGYSGIPNSLAVEFDAYRDDNDLGDPDGSHVAVFSNGKLPNSSNHKTSALMGCSSNIPLLKADSTVYFGKIEYLSKEKRLSIYLDTTGDYKYTVLVVDSLDLSKLLNLINSTNAYIGFTSATGASYQNTDLLSWSYCPKKGNTIQSDVEQTASSVPDDLTIFPNPVSDFLLIKTNSKSDKIEIFTLPGECVLVEHTSLFVPNSAQKIDVSGLVSGVYFLKIGNKVKIFVKN